LLQREYDKSAFVPASEAGGWIVETTWHFWSLLSTRSFINLVIIGSDRFHYPVLIKNGVFSDARASTESWRSVYVLLHRPARKMAAEFWAFLRIYCHVFSWANQLQRVGDSSVKQTPFVCISL
jgi:hypothetical protein